MGTVYLIGAGPGDPGLLTRRGAAILRRADVVLYDALLDRRVLDLAPASARRIDVGKRAAGRRVSQTRIHEILLAEARRVRTVVRLKGGDPFVFGRGGEEVRALADARVPHRVIPGVTSGLASLTWAGIPATQRGIASSVTLVTGHATAEGASPDWHALAAVGGTIVVYMGARTIDDIACRLMAGGRSGATPAAAIERATWSGGRVVEGTLASIAKDAEHAGIESPAVFAIGDVIALRRSRRSPTAAATATEDGP